MKLRDYFREETISTDIAQLDKKLVSGEHYIKKCKKCGKVMGQCRCSSENKKIIWDLCDDCK